MTDNLEVVAENMVAAGDKVREQPALYSTGEVSSTYKESVPNVGREEVALNQCCNSLQRCLTGLRLGFCEGHLSSSSLN